MRLVDLSHPWNIHTPPWMGYTSPKIYYTQRFSRRGVVSQFIETPLHIGTHIDSVFHTCPSGWDIASIPLDRVYGPGVIVDISREVGEFDVIKPEHLLKQPVEIRRGDILIYYTGWKRYYQSQPKQNEETYFCRHPGGYVELANWFVEMEFKITGMDTGTGDHPMNTEIKEMRPDIAREFEQKIGMPVLKVFPREHEYCMHKIPFPHGIVHLENIGGDVEQVLNQRCTISAIPWRFDGGEAAMVRVVAILDE